MKVPYNCNTCNSLCTAYYRDQAGGGITPFIGYRNQRGHGFFSSLFRYAVPILKKASLGVGRQLLKTGSNIIDDIDSGHNVLDSLKNRASQLPGQLLQSMTGGRKVKRRTFRKKPVRRSRMAKKRSTRRKSGQKSYSRHRARKYVKRAPQKKTKKRRQVQRRRPRRQQRRRSCSPDFFSS